MRADAECGHGAPRPLVGVAHHSFFFERIFTFLPIFSSQKALQKKTQSKRTGCFWL